MPKYRKRQLNKRYEYINNAAEGFITFATGKFLTYFGQGGTSFVLEDSEGNKVRFIFTPVHYTSSMLGGYFDDSNTLQPRYLNGDINFPTTEFLEGKEFFGYGWNQETDQFLASYEIGAAIKIFYGDISAGLTASDTDLTAVTELARRTAFAINYAQEIKLEALQTEFNVVKILQDITGIEGNTLIFRGFEEGLNGEGSVYGILTSDIATTDFSGGNVETITNFSPVSGILSKAFKKVLKDRNNKPSSLPVNVITSGKYNENIFKGFNDLSTHLFLESQSNIDAKTGVKLKSLDIVDNIPTDYLIYSHQDVSNITTTSQVNSLGIQNNLLSKTEIFDISNNLQVNVVNKDLIKSKFDIIKKRVYEEEYKSFSDSSSINSISESLTSYNNNSLFENESIFTQKEITFKLDFNSSDGSKDAVLVNTDFYKGYDSEAGFRHTVPQQMNFTKSGKIATINSLQTAYWNSIDKEWNYLDFNKYNTTEDKTGFIFPLNIVSSNQLDTNEIDERLRIVSNKNICFSPSYRPLDFNSNDLNFNSNKISQITKSYGFPTKYTWQPHKNHTIKLSDYISQDFYIEKIIIKGKCSVDAEKVKLNGNLKVSNNAAEFASDNDFSTLLPGISNYDANYISSGLNFFILKEENKPAKFNFPNLVSFFEAGSNITISNNDVAFERTDNNPGLLSLQTNGVLKTTDNDYVLFQRIIDNKVSSLSEFHKNEMLYLKNNSFQDDLYNKFFSLVKEENNSMNIHMSIHDLNEVFSEENNNLNTNISDFEIHNNSLHYQLEEKFLDDKVYLKPNKNRELLSYSNILFVNSQDDIFDLQDFKNVTSDSYVISLNTSNDFIEINERNFEVYGNINNVYSKTYTDKSLYVTKSNNDTNSSVFNILEGESDNFDYVNILKQKNNNNTSDLKKYIDDNNAVFDANNNIYNNKINASILKPDDTLTFGINAYNNGNLIGSITKLHDNLTITLIGKEVKKETPKNNYSSAISKTIYQNNKIKYKNLNTLANEQSFANNVTSKKQFSIVKKEKILKDTVWPNIVDIFNYFDKGFVPTYSSLAKYNLSSHFEDSLSLILSEDEFTDAEKSDLSQTYLSNVLTFKEWNNFDIFSDQINNIAFINNDRNISVLNTAYNYNNVLPDGITSRYSAFLKYDANGYDGNTIKNYITSKVYNNLNNRFVINYNDFSELVDSNDYSSLYEQINDDLETNKNLRIFGKPLYFNYLSDGTQNILESNYNINEEVPELTNFNGIFSLQKPQIYNRWCLVPLVEDSFDISSPLTGTSKIVFFLMNLATFCFKEDREKYFSYTGRVSSNYDDDYLADGFTSKALEFLSYEFKIKIPVRLGKVYKEFTTVVYTRSDNQSRTQEISDVNVIIPLEYYETGEFGYNLNIDNRQVGFSTASILEIDPDEYFTEVYLNQTINNFSLFNIFHSSFKEVNTKSGVANNVFDRSFFEIYANFSQVSHKFYQTFSEFLENLENHSYTNYSFKDQIWPNPAGLSFERFVEGYLTISYSSLNIDSSFNRIKPEVYKNGSQDSYKINYNLINSVNSTLNVTNNIENYINNIEDIHKIQHMFISNELVPNIPFALITLFLQPSGLTDNGINSSLESILSNDIQITDNDSAFIKNVKQFINFYISKNKEANKYSQLLENYEKFYTYKADNIETIFKLKDNYYNLNFEDVPFEDDDVFIGKNRTIDIKSFGNTYFSTKRDIPGVYDVVIDYDQEFETLQYKVKDPVKIQYNKDNNVKESINEFTVDFNDLVYDYTKIRGSSSIAGSLELNPIPLFNLQNKEKAYFNDITIDEKTKCIMYGISKNKEFAIRKIDKFRYGILTPYNHKKKYYLCNMNNNKQLNKLSGSKNYAYLDLKSNETVYPIRKNFINASFVYYNNTTINNADLETYNTDWYARQTSGFVDS